MNNRIVLTAGAGLMLTNGEHIGKVVYLGEHDSPENWLEIKEELAEQMLGLKLKEE